jgi:HEAT repeat protein
LAERLATQPALRRVILGALNGLEREQAAELPVKGVIACLDDEDSLHRQWALQILERVGLRAAGAVFRVRQLLDDPGYFVRAYAAQALGRISPQPAAVLPDLIRVLGDNEGFVRGFAASALGGLAIPPMEKFSVIRPFLGDPDSHVRRNAARVIGQAGPDAAAAVPELIALFADEDKWVRSAAAVALGQVGETAASACAALTALLTDPEGLPRDDAAQALGKLGPTARTAVPALLRVLAEDPELYVRASAAKTIVGLGAADQTGEGVARLRELLHDPNAVRRGGAAEILGALGPAARPAVPDLLAVLRDPVWGEAHADVRKDNISDNFQFCSDEELERRSHDRRTLVAAALGAIGAEPGVVKALGVAADDPDEQVGQAAVSALGKLRPAADAVLGGLHHHARESIRRSAAEALHPEHIPFRDPKV